MDYILNAKEMKNADKTTIEHFGVSSEVLMERAALSVALQILRDLECNNPKIVIMSSWGNNGGDGIAVARILKTKGYDPVVVMVGDKRNASPEALKQYKIGLNYELDYSDDPNEFYNADILVDALFGIGLNRDIESEYRNAVELFNNSNAYKYAIDIPSGVCADDGRILGIATTVNTTITFNFKKIGHLLFPGKECSGTVIVKDVGITKHSLPDSGIKCHSFTEDDLSLFPGRKPDSHKGDCGKIFIIAGSETYGGAAYLCAAAAFRCGCGLVKIYTHKNNRDFILEKLPEAVVEIYESNIDRQIILNNLSWADAVVIGPGIGCDGISGELVDIVLNNAKTPVVLDADALNIISKDVSVLLNSDLDLIITPHLGEMSRLKDETIEYIKSNMMSIAEDFAMDNGVICVLKSATTITSIPYGKTYINNTGNSGMSTAGSGDVLSGMIAALIGLGLKPNIAAPLGVYIHGLAGDYAREDCGESFMVASDIIDSLMLIFMESN